MNTYRALVPILIVASCLAAFAAYPSPLFDVIPPEGYQLEELELDIGYTYTFYNPEDRSMGLGILIMSIKPGEDLQDAVREIIGIDKLPGGTNDVGVSDLKKDTKPKNETTPKDEKVGAEQQTLVPKIINMRELEPNEAQRYGCEKGMYVNYDYLDLGVKYEMMFLQRKAKIFAVGFSLPVDKWADNAAPLRNAMLTFRVR
jgi:hypothetical protein